MYFGLKAQNTLKPRDRLRHHLLTDVYILLENVLYNRVRPLRNSVVNGRAASMYLGLKAKDYIRVTATKKISSRRERIHLVVKELNTAVEEFSQLIATVLK